MKQRFPLLVVSFISLMKEVFYSLFLQHAQPKLLCCKLKHYFSSHTLGAILKKNQDLSNLALIWTKRTEFGFLIANITMTAGAR